MSPLAVYSLLVVVYVAGAATTDAKGYIVFCPCMGECDHKSVLTIDEAYGAA